MKLLGAVAALLSVRRLPGFVSASLVGVVLWGAAALLGLYSLGSVVEAIGMITGLTGNADDIRLASIGYVIFFLLAAIGYVVLATSFSRRHGLGKPAALTGVLGAPLMLGLILAAIPALLAALGLLPGR